MDPITHGIIGAASGLAVVAAAPRAASLQHRRIAALCGFLAGEAPDADRVIDLALGCRWWGWEDGGGLAYMLYHRGFTHSVLGCVGAAGIVAGLAARVERTRALGFSLAFLAGLLGAVLHLALDATNDYGVHPFWPLYNRWFYGDFIFLGEPLVSAPLLAYVLVALGLAPRYLVLACAAAGIAWFGYGKGSGWLSWWGASIAFCWLLLHALVQRRRPNALFGWGGLVLVLAVFFWGSRLAKKRGAEALARLGSSAMSSDIITTPQGANPFCFRVITVTRSGDRFEVRVGVTTLLPERVKTTCFEPPEKTPVPKGACLEPFEGSDLPEFKWFATFQGSSSEFEALVAETPRASATRHFLRAPFWGPDARETACDSERNVARAGPKTVIGDMRVDYKKRELDHFCKYAFTRADKTPFHSYLPLPTPPFFESSPETKSEPLASKP